MSCWSGHYTEAYCCDPAFGAFGNVDCWDSYSTYKRCCPSPSSSSDAVVNKSTFRGKGWPPPGLLALHGPHGPLNFRAGTGTSEPFWDESTTSWYPLHMVTGLGRKAWKAVEQYSKGSMCSLEFKIIAANVSTPRRPEPKSHKHRKLPLWMAYRGRPPTRWFLWGSNCKPHYHCPLWAPIAAIVIDRAASISMLLWLAALDGRPLRSGIRQFEPLRGAAKPNLFDLWSSMALAYNFGDWNRLEYEWLAPEYATVETSVAQAESITARLTSIYDNVYEHDGISGRRLIMPPHLCPTCCRRAVGRLPVLIVRNPFFRLVSVFRLKWLHSELKVHNRWEDFPVFARYVSEVFNSTDAYDSLPDVFLHNGSAINKLTKEPEFVQWDLLHTRAISEWLQDRHLDKPVAVEDLHILYVERLREGLASMQEALCKKLRYCEKLPPFPRANSFEGALSKDQLRSCWGQGQGDTADMVRHRYAADLREFGYSMDPFDAQPRQDVMASRRKPVR
eukprot:TRINITY_DN50591_c0_g1_i1.p1 TRINITY_DN50591_c0_g1~~TRINITY_DN50591_c0_g1_i1.p1  ORF type:complete len:504 (+),score=48.79 TRINITY_DN50591_c0_g1_i1:149-1660(+)